ncbi:VWA domain-containing protein [Treponema phagedenis]|uniref:VWA domain-containing protein n=1 Tax=Treponema phagedenis TaxID=162 RepID=A0AAE6M8E6_TREPH|nr:VWA domain-containing protein [Treponema phagedenis]NVP22928.1 VWA domain-containing protein [Treponema phagedenis]QEJ98279.1 VWA domain-containing protein [Treponema phagedenis]QEK03790.1 VWA domain-containing protein [Treponema phagedenis]QEK09405.1 VWA domain-containing protein [Treponema phagedenis]QLC57816.1 VWA domain-containing protein [Treponema phagedenis]
MRKNKNNSRRFCRKALNHVSELEKKYPQGIPDITKIGEEDRAWFVIKIQHLRECLKSVWFENGKPAWWEVIRINRNKTAHQTEAFSDAEFLNLCNTFFQNCEQIKFDLKNNIKKVRQPSKEKRRFENFGSNDLGTEMERKQLVDAMEDAILPVEPIDEHITFPQNNFSRAAETVLGDILDNTDVKDSVRSHFALAENIQTDILDWLKKTQSQLEKENPFTAEALFIEQQKKLSTEELASDIANEKSKIQYDYKRLPSVSNSERGSIAESKLDFNFYQREFSDQKKKTKSKESKSKKDKTELAPKNVTTEIETLQTSEINEATTSNANETSPPKWKSKEKLEALRRNFINDMETNFIERKNKWEIEQIEQTRKKFFETLYQKIQNFMKLENLLLPFLNDVGRLWDLSTGIFQTSGFEILETFAKLLEQDEALQELAAQLGKHKRSQAAFEKALRDKVVIKTEWHPQPAYRGEIKGVKFSNDIASALPSELAMLKNPATKKLFQLKFAQKQLLGFDYQQDDTLLKKETETEEITKEKLEPQGPIIICVDTSGSMQGAPENIAKTVSFALAKIAIEEERKCYLISFSTGIETLDLSSGQGGNALSKLVQFLRMSFHGGTDATPALKHSLKMLHDDNYKNADVLMISDFVMNNLSDEIVKSIEAEKEKHTDFYSLVIGTSGNKNTIDCFNHNWLYNTNDPHASRRLVEHLHKLKETSR